MTQTDTQPAGCADVVSGTPHPRAPPPYPAAPRPEVIHRGIARYHAALASGASDEPGDQMTGDGVGAVDDGALPPRLLHLLDGVDRRKLTTSDVTRRLADALSVAERVLGVDRVGLMLLDENDDLQVVGASDAVSDRLERAQQRLRVGPAWDSLHSGRTVAVDDLATTGDGDGGYAAVWRWLQQRGADDGTEPADTPGAVPVRAVLSAAVRSGGEAVGSLNAMRAQSGPWTERQIRAVQACADVVGTLLALSASAAQPGVVPDPGHNG